MSSRGGWEGRRKEQGAVASAVRQRAGERQEPQWQGLQGGRRYASQSSRDCGCSVARIKSPLVDEKASVQKGVVKVPQRGGQATLTCEADTAMQWWMLWSHGEAAGGTDPSQSLAESQHRDKWGSDSLEIESLVSSLVSLTRC
ncbi:hypothetical protein GN956_G16187 [Arapaima gigas]